jgi:hypothetical protein
MYPTTFDRIHRPQVIRRIDSIDVLDGLARLRRLMAAPSCHRWSGARASLRQDFENARRLSRAYHNESKHYGFRLP